MTRLPGAVVSTISAIVDLPLAMPHLPQRGGDVLGTASAPTPGGGVNIALASARQDVATFLLSPLGAGPNGALCAGTLEAEGVGLLIPPVAGADTGLCVTVTEPDGERTFLSAPGVEAALTIEQLTTAERTSGRPKTGDVVVVSGYDLAYDGGADLARWVAGLASGVVVVLDPGPLVGELDREVLGAVVGRVDVLTLNERETEILGGEAAVVGMVPEGAAVLLRAGARGCVVVRAGVRAGVRVEVPSIEVEAVDTTGAGDAHTGVLAAGLVGGVLAAGLAGGPRQVDLAAVARRANIAGAFTASRQGPATCPTRGEIDVLAGSV